MRRGLLILAALALLARPLEAAEVTLDGQVLMRLGSQAQAQAVEVRIQRCLEAGLAPAAVRVEKGKGKASIYWGSVLIVEVTADLAAANRSQPADLASRWAALLRRAAARGALRVEPSRLSLPVGGEQVLQLSGLARGPISVREPSGLLEVRVDPQAGQVGLKGLAAGKTRLEIRRGRARATVYVQVKDWAGRPPEKVLVQVTGNPAPSSLVAQAALEATWAESRVNPGCRLVLPQDLSLPSVPPGQQMTFPLPVEITGNDNYFPVRKNVSVTVTNLPLEQVDANLLLVSNRPESLEVDGVLLDYTFRAEEPTRLMYSHENRSPGPRHLWVNLTNPDPTPVRLWVSHTYAGPDSHIIHVGHTAAARFLEYLGQGAGYVLTLPPRSSLELAGHLMGPGTLVSGFANLRILEGQRVQVQVATALHPAVNDPSRLPHLGAPFNPFKIHPHGVFAQPYFEEELEYQVGGQPAVVRYGQSPWLIDFETGLPNTGNFGVLYKARVTLRNPDTSPRQVGFYFSPLQGPAGGTFLIDGQLRQAPFRKPPQEELVGTVELAPGEERTVDLVTFPEASSNYPAEVRIRDVLLQPASSGGGGSQ